MYNDKFWNTLITTSLMSGCAHQHIETPEQGFLEIIDDYGNQAIWYYDKINQKIVLEEA